MAKFYSYNEVNSISDEALVLLPQTLLGKLSAPPEPLAGIWRTGSGGDGIEEEGRKWKKEKGRDKENVIEFCMW